MANKKYVNDSMQNSTFQVNSHKPMDDRLVIRLRENLMQSETWQLTSNGDVMLYSGIVVNVIDDTDANNGLYSLKNWTKYDKQSWDETDNLTYDPAGWRKLDSDVFWVTLSSPVTSLSDITSDNIQSDKTVEEICNAYSANKYVIYQLQYSIENNLLHQDTTYILTQYSNQYRADASKERYVITLYLLNQLYSSHWRVTLTVLHDFSNSSLSQISYIISKYSQGPAVRTMNHEQLTDGTLGDINIHDGYYFPNAVQDYDGNWYGAVIIGDQVWLGENLRTTSDNEGASITYYSLPGKDVKKYGYGYLWTIAIGDILPTGFHLPSEQEFQTLFSYVRNQTRYALGSDNRIGKALASTEDWNTLDNVNAVGNNLSINNKTGFNVYPTGHSNTNVSKTAYLWTSDESSSDNTYAKLFAMNEYDTDPSIITQTKGRYFYIRCISNLTPVQFRNWYVATYGTMQHHLNENIIVNQNYDLYRCVMSYDAWISVMGSGDYPAGTQLFEFTMPTNPYITLNHTDKPNRNPIIISKFNATNGQYEPLLPQQQSFVGLNRLITDAATNDHGAYQFELLPDMVNPVYHVFDIQHGLYAVWHKNGDAEMGNASTVYQGILIGVTTSIGNDTEEIAFMIKIYKNSVNS